MRALILIVSCVIALAILQASYLVVDAHTSGGAIIRITDDGHQAAAHPHPHHGAQATPQAGKDTRDQAKMLKAARLTPMLASTTPSIVQPHHQGINKVVNRSATSRSRAVTLHDQLHQGDAKSQDKDNTKDRMDTINKEDLVLLRQLCQRQPKLSRCRTEYVVHSVVHDKLPGGSTNTGAGSTKGNSPGGYKNNMVDRIPNIQGNKLERGPNAPASDAINETIRQILELAIDGKPSAHQVASGFYGQGAHHQLTITSGSKSSISGSSSASSSSTSGTSNNQQLPHPIMQTPPGGRDEPSSSSAAGDPPSTHQQANIRQIHHKDIGYHNYHINRYIHLHRAGCTLDRDCGTGCCLESRNGRKTCRRGGMKGIGKRCTSNCMCVQGLHCWVAGTKHTMRKVHKAWGRCRDPNYQNLGTGFFMDSDTNT